jgi:hypothetical protein
VCFVWHLAKNLFGECPKKTLGKEPDFSSGARDGTVDTRRAPRDLVPAQTRAQAPPPPARELDPHLADEIQMTLLERNDIRGENLLEKSVNKYIYIIEILVGHSLTSI